MNHYRVLSERPLDEGETLYHVRIRHWWALWLDKATVPVICLRPGLTMVDARDFTPIRNIFVQSAICRHLDLVGKRERREAADLKEKYQQKGLH